MTKRIFLSFVTFCLAGAASAQYAWQEDADPGKCRPGKGINYKVEMQGSASSGKTPLWLNANKYGLSSLKENNGYLRVQAVRPLSNDSARRWGLGYGLDVASPVHYTSHVVVQQAFAEMRWLHATLTVGAKEWPMELKNNALSSGSQAFGINARPVPQVRLALPRYWTLPFANRWLHFKGHIAYGRLTDQNWQHDFTNKQTKYADDVLYHSKAGYLMIGNPDRFCPWSLELGLEMATIFGGTVYHPAGNGKMNAIHNGTGLKDYFRAFVPGGADAPEIGSNYQNEEGDIVGAWVTRFNYEADSWKIGIYADKFFEDHSSMLQLDYDGYGSGEEWNVKKRHHYFLYDFKDWMLGAELNLRNGTWLRDIVFEYLYTKYQSGPLYHDHTIGRPEHICGADNFYNHYLYPGWQHWGQVMGNPLYRSPIYNTDGTLTIKDNRFTAFHLGFDGQPTDALSYRVLASWQEGLGTYARPYTKKRHNVSFMVEAQYALPNQWNIKAAYGMDFGSILGHNRGAQLTISKAGIFNL